MAFKPVPAQCTRLPSWETIVCFPVPWDTCEALPRVVLVELEKCVSYEFCPQVPQALSAWPPASWAQKSGSALGGHIGPEAPSRRSTEARDPNTSCHRTPVARAGAGEEVGKVVPWAVYTGAWTPETELCLEQNRRPKDERVCSGTALVKWGRERR